MPISWRERPEPPRSCEQNSIFSCCDADEVNWFCKQNYEHLSTFGGVWRYHNNQLCWFWRRAHFFLASHQRILVVVSADTHGLCGFWVLQKDTYVVRMYKKLVVVSADPHVLCGFWVLQRNIYTVRMNKRKLSLHIYGNDIRGPYECFISVARLKYHAYQTLQAARRCLNSFLLVLYVNF